MIFSRKSFQFRRFAAIGILPILGACIVMFSSALRAQNATPIRIAIVSEESAGISDLLTSELSQKPSLQLLERDQVAKIYREQKLASANLDYVKLGQMLGADGLLLLNLTREGTNQTLRVRLVATKPGVVIAARSAPWPLADVVGWVPGLVRHLNPLFPKLMVPRAKATPISIVNLRSALRSQEAEDVERQLTVLLTERLTREPEVFVLERRRMDLLGAETELQGMGESEFWNGSYLLEGVVDRDGYSPETITLSARLVAPLGKAAVRSIEVSGARANLSDVINRLVEAVKADLKIATRASAWEPAAEARKYFDEAGWALKWGTIAEAQAASESFWALGKRDVDAATLRVKAYMAPLARRRDVYEYGNYQGLTNRPDITTHFLHELERDYIGAATQRTGERIKYCIVRKAPEVSSAEQATRLLAIYYQYCQTMAPDQPAAGSPWFDLGVETLEASSRVLQHFCLATKAQAAASDQLAELRALTRTVAGRLSQPVSVHGAYWPKHRIVLGDDVSLDAGKGLNLFRCKMDYGLFWQDRPDDCAALYRELASSPMFAFIHEQLWYRGPDFPRITGWNAADRSRAPLVWKNLVKELTGHTNPIVQIEGRFLEFADACSGPGAEPAFTALFNAVLTNREAIVSSDVELLHKHWGADWLLGGLRQIGGIPEIFAPPGHAQLRQRYTSEYLPQLRAMHQEFRERSSQRSKELKQLAEYDAQKQFLQAQKPHDSTRFLNLFRTRDHTKSQALELQGLVSSYKSNLLTMVAAKPEAERGLEMFKVKQVEEYERTVNGILGLTNLTVTGATKPPPRIVTPPPAPALKIAPALTPVAEPAPVGSNALLVSRFLGVPKVGLNLETIEKSKTVGSRYRDGKVFLDVRYSGFAQRTKTNEFISSTNVLISLANAFAPPTHLWFSLSGTNTYLQTNYLHASRAVAAVLDFAPGAWEIVHHPGYAEDVTRPGSGLALGSFRELFYEKFAGNYYFSDWAAINKFDPATKQVTPLSIPGEKLARLFTVHGRLLAANEESIFELLDNGQRTRLLASTRRRPTVSALDSLENLGLVTLFPGPQGSIRANIGQKILSWEGRDWKESQPILPANAKTSSGSPELARLVCDHPPEVFASATIVRSQSDVWLLSHNETIIERCWTDELKDTWPRPTWQSVPGLELSAAAAALVGSNLVFLVDRSSVTVTNNGQRVIHETAGRHADLVYLDRALPQPLVIPVRFDATAGTPPSNGSLDNDDARAESFWLGFTADQLLIGQRSLPGIWTISTPELNTALAQERTKQQGQVAQTVATGRRDDQTLLGKYDRNRNGKVDRDEAAVAIDDPLYLATVIDALTPARDGRIHFAAMAFFDVNTNRVLEAKEYAGLQTGQRLAMERLFRSLDRNRDQRLSLEELRTAQIPQEGSSNFADNVLPRYDKDGDSRMAPEELEIFMLEQTMYELSAPFVAARRFDLMSVRGNPSPAEQIKQAIEALWKNPELLAKANPTGR